MVKLHTQQGDCLLEIVNEIPQKAKKVKFSGSLIVLKGEGVNTHEITDIQGLEVYEVDNTLYLKTSKPIEIIHQEHGRTTLEPNKIYRRRIEREWNYEEREAQQTRD